MPDRKDVEFLHINDIEPVITSHGVGEKRVIATRANAGIPITQIARTKLLDGEVVEEHVHPTMDEHFFFLEGECEVVVDGNVVKCVGDDYLLVPAGHYHGLKAVAIIVVITLGIALE